MPNSQPGNPRQPPRLGVSARRAGCHAVETEVLEADESRLIETPEVRIFQHLHPLFCIRRTVLSPKLDISRDSVWLGVLETGHDFRPTFLIQSAYRTVVHAVSAFITYTLRGLVRAQFEVGENSGEHHSAPQSRVKNQVVAPKIPNPAATAAWRKETSPMTPLVSIPISRG